MERMIRNTFTKRIGGIRIEACVNIPAPGDSGGCDSHFSLTYGSWTNRGRQLSFGQCREYDQHFPEFADVRALHLSDPNGEPMHATANGWYWLAGALGGLGERYHGGGDPNGPSYSRKAPHECARILCEHMRWTDSECWAALTRIARVWDAFPGRARHAWDNTVASQRERWRNEADACRAKHGVRP